MSETIAEILSAGRVDAGLSARDLWFSYCGLGGQATPRALDRFLTGTAIPSAHQYDILAQAINEALVDLDMDTPLPYAEDLVR
ncbi:MAG: hypothetical protein ABWZ76_14580 [Acidimicrobiales bacterium]